MKHYHQTKAFVIRVSGKDAERYSHNRLTQDIRSMPIGSIRPAAMTDPQSKIEGLFSVIRTGQTDFLLIARSGLPSDQLTNFKRFQVADSVLIDQQPEALLYFLNGEGTPTFLKELLQAAPPSRDTEVKQAQNVLCWKAFDGWEVLTTSTIKIDATALTADDFLKLRIQFNVPLLEEEIALGTPLMNTGLRHFIGFGAGCYIGQEVIEKVDARGKAPLQLLRLEIDSSKINSDEPVFLLIDETWRLSGKVLSSVRISDSKSWAFAQTKNSPYAGIKVGESEAKELISL